MEHSTNNGPEQVVLSGVVLDSPDPRRLADFYRRLLGWRITDDQGTWVVVSNPAGGVHLAFQHEPDYRPPTWPTGADRQQMMLHLDIDVSDLAATSARAEQYGARLADFQPQEHVRVYLDPDGHPFCLAREL